MAGLGVVQNLRGDFRGCSVERNVINGAKRGGQFPAGPYVHERRFALLDDAHQCRARPFPRLDDARVMGEQRIEAAAQPERFPAGGAADDLIGG